MAKNTTPGGVYIQPMPGFLILAGVKIWVDDFDAVRAAMDAVETKEKEAELAESTWPGKKKSADG